MESKIIIFVFYIFFSLQLRSPKAQTWIRAGYYSCSYNDFPISNINSSLFTHLICAYAKVNSTSYQLLIAPSDEIYFSTFTHTVKQKNPSVTTLLSIKDYSDDYAIFSSMASNPSYRKFFIESSIKTARLYGFQGLDLTWNDPSTKLDMFNMGILFREWRAAIGLEAKNSNHSQLILTARVNYSPSTSSGSYSIDVIHYLDWVHVVSDEYSSPDSTNVTSGHAALYDPTSSNNTDYGIKAWLRAGLSANKLVFAIPYYGYAWTLVNPEDNVIGAPAKGPAITEDGFMTYKEIKDYIAQYGPNVHVMYNESYVVNYCTIGTYWIGFDDVEAVRAKVSYAKEKGLLGYYVWKVSYDDNWQLSQAAADDINNSSIIPKDNKNISSNPESNTNGHNKKRLFLIVFCTTAAVIILLGVFVVCHCWRTKFKETVDSAKQSNDEVNKAAASGDFNSNVPNLKEYTLADIEAATNGFSMENKLGQGGYGPVYKGVLPDGQEIAVKKLSKTSSQGFEEFKNEVMLTAKLQHVNLVKVLGFCIDGEEQILIYEYMPNKSLDSYIFDPIRRYILDWKKRVHIIEGITQGLLYLQEYSRLTIIHRDLKVSNILLDGAMKPKISDFGIARIFAKDDLEVSTKHIVGTEGYVPPEYVQRGIYSTKSDVYSFGVLLLEIISGKRISGLYGLNESLTLLHYAYELWKDGKGMEFMDESLDDKNSLCKLIRCLQIALLCVQDNPIDRPSMLEVFSLLKTETMNMMIPKKPASFKQNERHQSTMQLESYCGGTSSNDVTISEVVAR